MDAAPQAYAAAADRRAGLVAAVAGLVLLPWFWAIVAIAGFRPVSPPLGSPDQEFIEFYVDNFSRVPLNTTLFIGQRVIILVLLVSVVRAACGRLDLAAILSLARSHRWLCFARVGQSQPRYGLCEGTCIGASLGPTIALTPPTIQYRKTA